MTKRIFSSAVLVAFLALAVGTGDDDDSSSADVTGTVNEEVTVGDFAYKVQQPQFAVVVGSSYSQKFANASAVYVVVRFSERNDGNESHQAIGNPLKFKDSQGREFTPDTEATMALRSSENLQFMPQLQPGLETPGIAVFQVPRESATGTCTVVIEERGIHLSPSIGQVAVAMPAALPPASPSAPGAVPATAPVVTP